MAAAVAAVLRARHAVTDMAYFAARETSPAATCVEVVAKSDVYVGIIGLRYGSHVRDRGMSPTLSRSSRQANSGGSDRPTPTQVTPRRRPPWVRRRQAP